MGAVKAYPISEDEILSTWKTRASLWTQLHISGGGRIFRCVTHNFHPVKVIDMNSYDETN
jgi:hypothetical protein